MAAIWQAAPAPFIDPNGAPYSGARAYFFDAGTTTPRVVYTDPLLSVAHDHPVVAGGSGIFPPVYLPQGDYRVRVTTAQGVTLFDADGITTPISSSGGGGGGGGGDDSNLMPGDMVLAFRQDVRAGWVRCNGRTIGSAASGATERASPDCEALFLHLWSTGRLDVIGGRGASAAGDWAANKQVRVPDARGLTLAGVDDMGAGPAGLVPTALLTAPASQLAAQGGASYVSLSVAQLPSHNHGGATAGAGAHSHEYQRRSASSLSTGTTSVQFTANASLETAGTSAVEDHAHLIPAQGGNQGHPNLQPTVFFGVYIKL